MRECPTRPCGPSTAIGFELRNQGARIGDGCGDFVDLKRQCRLTALTVHQRTQMISSKKMFPPDSEMAKAFACGGKIRGVPWSWALFFFVFVQQEIKKSDCCVILFDESRNDFLHQKQMDVHIRHWDSSRRVTTRYFTSVIMGHATADDVQEKLLSSLEPLLLSKVLQISMDGPSKACKSLTRLTVLINKKKK